MNGIAVLQAPLTAADNERVMRQIDINRPPGLRPWQYDKPRGVVFSDKYSKLITALHNQVDWQATTGFCPGKLAAACR